MKISQNLLGFGCNFPVMIQLIEFCSKFINYRHYTIILPFLPLSHVVYPYNDLQGEALPKTGTFFRRRLYERVGIALGIQYIVTPTSLVQ